MSNSQVKPVVSKLRSDPKYKRLKELFVNNALCNLNLEELEREISAIHKMRRIRQLNPDDPKFIDAVVRANTDDQAQRSRLSEIIISCVRAHNLLKPALDILREHYFLNHSDLLRVFRTREERNLLLDSVLSRYYVYLDKIATLKETAKIVIEDIDKGSWSLRATIDVAKLHYVPERQL